MPRDGALADAATDRQRTAAEIAYFCVRCGRLVTTDRWRLAMNGDHEHVVFNPAGLVFRILCFKEAPGIEAVGPPSGDFTWFAGYNWRIGRCCGCGGHLGWRYQGEAAPAIFFGLIKPMLTIGSTSTAPP